MIPGGKRRTISRGKLGPPAGELDLDSMGKLKGTGNRMSLRLSKVFESGTSVSNCQTRGCGETEGEACFDVVVPTLSGLSR